MKTNKLILFLFCLLPFSFNYAENKNSDRLYQDWFEDIKKSCDKDNGNLWGINLYATLLCIDSERISGVIKQTKKTIFISITVYIKGNFLERIISPILSLKYLVKNGLQ